MKKILAIAVALLMVLSLAGCGKSEPAPAENGSGTVDASETVDGEAEQAEETAEEPEQDEGSSDSDSGLLSPEFKQTMDDYEAWFDHYCDVMKRYEENSSDLTLLSEMTELLSEETEMLEEMENMDQSEMNAAELAYYLEVTARIKKNLLEVADY